MFRFNPHPLEAIMRRSFLLFGFLGLVLASNAWAIDIDGRWGLGVGAGGVIGTNSEFSIFHGHSKHTGWLLDFGISGTDHAESGSTTLSDTSSAVTIGNRANHNTVSAFAGPRVRYFSRPDASFSPYVDLFLQGSYGHVHDWSVEGRRDTRSTYGFSTGLALGAEYFTPWHFSLAAHSTLVSLGWTHFREHREYDSPYGDIKNSTSGHDAGASISLRPILFLRTYF